MTDKDLVSKCVAIEYGVFIAAIILLVVFAFNWYSDYSTKCLATCKLQQQACKTSCLPEVKAAMQTSSFGAKKVKDVLRQAFKSADGKISEKSLHEGFLNYSPNQSSMDFQSYYEVPDEDNKEAYDPAKDSLEQSVYDSHQEFVQDSYISTQGPSSTNVERDDTNEVNKRWGLRRVDYDTAISGDDARTVSSEYPEQVHQETNNFML